MQLIRQAALLVTALAVLRFVETLVLGRPPDGTPLLQQAFLASGLFWLVAALLGLVVAAGWAAHRVFGTEKKAAPVASVRLTGEARLRAWGFTAVAGWAGFSLVTLIVMADTQTGPFAAFATGILGLRDFVGVTTFLVGLPAFMAPLIVLAVLPRQPRWPLLAGMQDAVKPVPHARRRR